MGDRRRLLGLAIAMGYGGNNIGCTKPKTLISTERGGEILLHRQLVLGPVTSKYPTLSIKLGFDLKGREIGKEVHERYYDQQGLSNDEDTRYKSSKVEKLSIKKKGMGSEGRAEHMAKADTDLQLLSKADKERQLHKLKKRRLHGREEDTLARLEKFKNSISKKIDVYASSNSKGNDEDDESGWISNRLTFVPDHSGKDDMTRRDDPNEYVVLDPLLEKGKEKFNKMQAKLKRRDREWAGRSLT